MLIPFFYLLREGGMKTSITELLTLLEAMKKGLAGQSVDDFYYLARASLVKDEADLDRFDRIFGAYYKGIEDSLADLMQDIPEDWLRHQAELMLSEEERARIEALGGFEELMRRSKNGSMSRMSAMKAAIAGSGRPVPRRSARTATTPRACAWGNRVRAIAVP